MQYADLKSQRENNIAWRLLTSSHEPLIASFLYQSRFSDFSSNDVTQAVEAKA